MHRVELLAPARPAARFAVFIVITGLLCAPVSAQERSDVPAGLSPAAGAALQAFLDGPGAGFDVGIDPRTGAVRRLRGLAEPLGRGLAKDAAGHSLPLAEAFIARFGAMFGLADGAGDLVLQDAFDSLGARHARFRQAIDGIEVVYGILNLHFTRDGNLMAADSTLATAEPQGGWFTAREDALTAIRQFVRSEGSLPGASDSVEPMWFSSTGGGLLPVWRVLTSSRSPLASYEGYVDAMSGEVIDVRNRLCFATGSGMVFDPNPVVALMDPTLTNMGDSCYPAMMSARTSVTLERLDPGGRLTGQWASTSASSVPRASEPSLVFDFCRDTAFFSEVMVYYHVDTQQAWIQSLGFTNINNRQQVMDPYLTCGVPNAFYDPATLQISFCRDGIDSSEDAEVIIHEYGHSIHHNQVPGWGFCEEGGAMGEGFGDYLAESRYTHGPGSFQYGETADWFGVNSPSPETPGTGLRWVISPKVYPVDYVGEVHADGEIWSAALWQIWEGIGRTVTDSLVLQSHFFLTGGADFMDGGEALMMADQVLYGGANQAVIEAALRSRGLYFPEDSHEPNDTEAAASPLRCGHNGPLVIASGDTDWYTFEVRSPGGWLTFYYHGVSPAGSTTCIVPYDLTIMTPGGTPMFTTLSGGVTERVDFAGMPAGTYKVRVFGNSGARFSYDLDYVEINDGTATFSGVCGDCNGDGLVNILDALLGAQTAASIATPPDPAKCDVDASGTVSVIDALLMAQEAAGLSVSLNCVGGVCGQGSATDIACGGSVMDSLSVSTDPVPLALTVPGSTHHYRLTAIPPSTGSITLSLTGTGDMDMIVGRPGTLPGSTNINRYPTSTDMRSTGPTSTETIVLNAGTIYTPADFNGGPISIAITSWTAGSYTLSVTCP